MARDHAKQTGIALEKAYQFTLWLVPTVDKFPRNQKFLIGDRIETAALDVVEGIVDATYTRNRAPILRKVNLRLEKLRLLFRLSVDLKLVDTRRYEHAVRWRDGFSLTLPPPSAADPSLSRFCGRGDDRPPSPLRGEKG